MHEIKHFLKQIILEYLLSAVRRVSTYEYQRSNLQSQTSKGITKVYSLQLRKL